MIFKKGETRVLKKRVKVTFTHNRNSVTLDFRKVPGRFTMTAKEDWEIPEEIEAVFSKPLE